MPSPVTLIVVSPIIGISVQVKLKLLSGNNMRMPGSASAGTTEINVLPE